MIFLSKHSVVSQCPGVPVASREGCAAWRECIAPSVQRMFGGNLMCGRILGHVGHWDTILILLAFPCPGPCPSLGGVGHAIAAITAAASSTWPLGGVGRRVVA